MFCIGLTELSTKLCTFCFPSPTLSCMFTARTLPGCVFASDTPGYCIITNRCFKTQTSRRCTSCVSREKNGAGESYVCARGVHKRDHIDSRGNNESSGETLSWFIRDLSVQLQPLRGQDREKEEGKDKCQSVQTCFGIWGRRGETARGKSKESSGVNIKCFTRVKVLREKYSFD